MSIGIGQLDRTKMAALYGYNANFGQVQNNNNPVSTQRVDVNAINELARKNASQSVGKSNPYQEAGAVSSANPVAAPQVAQQPTVKVDAKMATSVFGKQVDSPSATKYNNFAADLAYKGAAKSNTGYGEYDGLKSFKSNQTSPMSNNDNSIFNAVSGVNSATAGLNFGGVTNQNPAQKMFIA